MKRPVIGVTPLYDAEKQSFWMLPAYFDLIYEAGGLPIMLSPGQDENSARAAVCICQGILFTGGQDVSPSIYGENVSEHVFEICPLRDDFESALLKEVLRSDVPAFGICRGIQFFNAFLGGTLYQHLPTEHPSQIMHSQKPPYDIPWHFVKPVPGSHLTQIIGEECHKVNTFHHQAVKDLAPNLIAEAMSEDGLVEAVRHTEHRFLSAVQWHPEYIFRRSTKDLAIIEDFVGACGNK